MLRNWLFPMAKGIATAEVVSLILQGITKGAPYVISRWDDYVKAGFWATFMYYQGSNAFQSGRTDYVLKEALGGALDMAISSPYTHQCLTFAAIDFLALGAMQTDALKSWVPHDYKLALGAVAGLTALYEYGDDYLPEGLHF